MSATRRSSRRKSPRAKAAQPLDLWRPLAPLPPLAPIVPTSDPTATMRSLGDPPLQRGADHYLLLAAIRASGLATALAAAAGLVASADTE